MLSLARHRRFHHLCASAAVSLLNRADPSTSAKPKSLEALSLLRSEKDPSRILSISRAAALSPDSHPDRAALSLAVSNLSSVRSLLDGLLSSPLSDRLRPHAIVLFGQAGMLHDALRSLLRLSLRPIPQRPPLRLHPLQELRRGPPNLPRFPLFLRHHPQSQHLQHRNQSLLRIGLVEDLLYDLG